MNTMRSLGRFAVLATLGLVLVGGCKRESNTAESSSASGSGSVSINGHVVAYQNLHIEVPWDMSDPSKAMKATTDAARGKGLTLTDGKDTLVIASDGGSIQLNGRPYGQVKPGDKIQLTADHKLMVNGAPRTP